MTAGTAVTATLISATLISHFRRDRRAALDLGTAVTAGTTVTATLISHFEGGALGALGTTMRPGISSSTRQRTAPPFEVDQHAVSASTLAGSLVHRHHVTAAQPWTWGPP